MLLVVGSWLVYLSCKPDLSTCRFTALSLWLKLSCWRRKRPIAKLDLESFAVQACARTCRLETMSCQEFWPPKPSLAKQFEPHGTHFRHSSPWVVFKFSIHMSIYAQQIAAVYMSLYVYLTEDTIQRLNMIGHIFLTWNHSKTCWDHGLLCGSRCGYQLDGVCLSMYAAQNVCGLTFIDHLAGQLIVVCGIIIFVIPLMHRYYLIGIRLLSLHFLRSWDRIGVIPQWENARDEHLGTARSIAFVAGQWSCPTSIEFEAEKRPTLP